MADKVQKIQKLADNGKWAKIEKKFFYANAENRLALSEALGNTSGGEECYNMLFELIKDNDKAVQLAAVKALGKCGVDNAVARLQWVLERASADEKELIDELHTAIKTLRGKK